MTKKYAYDYYDIDIPDDCYDTEEERLTLAFIAAEQAARLWTIPSVWYIVKDDENNLRVCRKRYYHGKDDN